MKPYQRKDQFDNAIEVSPEFDIDKQIEVMITSGSVDAIAWLDRGQLKALYRHIGKLLIG